MANLVKIPNLKNVSRLMATLIGTGGKKVDPKSLTPMVYPYTVTAQLIHFPYKYVFKNAWLYRYMFYCYIGTLPLWFYISYHVNSKEAKKAWNAKKALDFEKEHLKEWEVL